MRTEVVTSGLDIDTDRIEHCVLALLYLGLHSGYRTWKGFDWAAMDRLYEKGMITQPAGKAKSVIFTEEGFERSEQLFHEMFACKRDARERG